jgi:hypothetical protein
MKHEIRYKARDDRPRGYSFFLLTPKKQVVLFFNLRENQLKITLVTKKKRQKLHQSLLNNVLPPSGIHTPENGPLLNNNKFLDRHPPPSRPSNAQLALHRRRRLGTPASLPP